MSDTSKKYFITGGGTGGHIYPAIAVANKLGKENIIYIGNPKNLEYKIAQQNGFKFLPVSVSGMPRKLGLNFIFWGIQFLFSTIKAFYYIKKYKPDAIFGTGGYVSAPIIFAAMFEGKTPYMLHDCDSIPGLVTRKTAPKAVCVSLAFDAAKKYINNPNCIVNGNPIRPEFKTLGQNFARVSLNLDESLTLGIMGGSQGSKSINDSATEIIRELSEKYGIQIIFQTGIKHYGDVTERLSKIYPNYEDNTRLIVKPYFDDMVTVLKSCDIVISRAGSLSISEICASNLASILVPYPHAAANHQQKNADFLLSKGACIIISDNELNPNSLMDTIIDLISTPQKISYIKQNASDLAKTNALDEIVNQLEHITK